MTPTILKNPVSGHGGGTIQPPPQGGGNDPSAGGSQFDYGERLRRARLGMGVMLAAIVMLFVAFTSAYIVRKGLPTFNNGTQIYERDWIPVNLPQALLILNTCLLLVSSLTMEFARRQITRQAALAPLRSIPGVSLGHERLFPWLGVTLALGLGFLAGQLMTWRALRDAGFYLSTNPSNSFVYLLTGVHAVHLAGGVIVLLSVAISALLKKPVEARRISVDVTAWYWHFLTLLWIYVFALLELAR